MSAAIKHIRTASLDVAYEESGNPSGDPVFLMHGWPYDPRDYDDVLPALGAAGCRIIVPYLRGFGATRFLSTGTPRSGQQAALGNDLRELMDALSAQRAVLAGYDWGGRAACILSALWPERVRGLVTGNSYNIQDIPNSGRPASPEQEHRLWYQYYFSTERGRAGLEANRKAFCRLLWKLWSPHWVIRRCHLRAQRKIVRQPGFRRGDDPVLSPSLRLCARRPGGGSHRATSGAAAPDRGADYRLAGRGRRCAPAANVRAPRQVLRRTV